MRYVELLSQDDADLIENFRRTGQMESIRLLHLSDLHQGLRGQKILWPEVKSELQQDLKRLVQKSGPLDLVVFTGDMTQRGSPEEFVQLDRTLDELWTWLNSFGCNPQMVFVPGNHDLVRPKSTSAIVKALSLWNQDAEVRDVFWSEPKGEYRRAVEKAFKPFTEWAHRRGQNSTLVLNRGLLPGDFSVGFKKNKLSLGIVGLNSAFLQLSGRDFEGSLDVDPRQLNAVCGGDPPAWLEQHHVSLLLTHHPASWLSQAARDKFKSNIDRPSWFLAHMHGHTHQSASLFSHEGGASPRGMICGASLFGLENWETPSGSVVRRIHGYSIIEVKIDSKRGTLTLWPRSLEFNEQAQYRRIIPDNRRYDLNANESVVQEFHVRKEC